VNRFLLRRCFAAVILLLSLTAGLACGGRPGPAPEPGPGTCPPLPDPVYNEPWRPGFHFTPEQNWMNDPNGLVCFRGEYHLFYQHQPEIPFFGPMYWGHAVSRDLVRWKHLPVALAPDPVEGQAYSGSAVVDQGNTSGLCLGTPGGDAACLAFLFTRHGGTDGMEKQDLAFSNDAGRTLELYAHNPVLPNPGAGERPPSALRSSSSLRRTEKYVRAPPRSRALHPDIPRPREPKGAAWPMSFPQDVRRTAEGAENDPDPGSRDFRDPKVFWHEATGRWILVLAAGDRVQFFASADLREWTWLSDFGPAGTEPGVWECPDLFELPVEGLPGETRWVLKVDFNPGIVIGDSGAQFFVGRFDGTRFSTDQVETRRVDFGADFYAAQSWSGTPPDRRIWIAWMNNWRYALFTPTDPWRGAMTVPREVRLSLRGEEIVLVQSPVPELETLRRCLLFRAGPLEVHGETDLPDRAAGDALEIRAVLDVRQARRAGIRVRVSPDRQEATEIAYDAERQALSIDRGRSGAFFSERFSGLQSSSLPLEDGLLDLLILVDRSSVEVFAAGGRVVMTDLVFPDPQSRGIGLFAEGGPSLVLSLEIHSLDSVW
jgi:sucrose-6-phosphate hydrolase SacC (GH32 family)